METTDILSKITAIIADTNGVEASSIKPTDNFRSDLDFDSLDSVEFSMQVETEFNVKFTDDEMVGIVTVQDAVDLVGKKLA
jgi:acyl carrier protein